MDSLDLQRKIEKTNVGRIAERIVANELEFLGCRVSDLSKEGNSSNADLLAVSPSQTWQVQVKGASNAPSDEWWVGYGHCTENIINRREPVFNRRKSFYHANMVVLVAVRSPSEYKCIALPIDKAEAVAQINVNRAYRTLTSSGEHKKPHKMWVSLEPTPHEWKKSEEIRDLYSQEREILSAYSGWEVLREAACQNR